MNLKLINNNNQNIMNKQKEYKLNKAELKILIKLI